MDVNHGGKEMSKLKIPQFKSRRVNTLAERFAEDQQPLVTVPAATHASRLRRMMDCILALWAGPPKTDRLTETRARVNIALDAITVKECRLRDEFEAAARMVTSKVNEKRVHEAVLHLRRKKRLEVQLTRINNHKYNLHAQLAALEATEENKDVLSIMKDVSSTLKAFDAPDQDAVNDTMEDMREVLEDAATCSQYLSEKTVLPDLLDDGEDLEAEVRLLMGEQPPAPPPPVASVHFPMEPTTLPHKADTRNLPGQVAT